MMLLTNTTSPFDEFASNRTSDVAMAVRPKISLGHNFRANDPSQGAIDPAEPVGPALKALAQLLGRAAAHDVHMSVPSTGTKP
jgi:hypothetical protein